MKKNSFCHRKPRSKLPTKILILLCMSLMLLLMVFLTGIERTSDPKACRATAVLLHYFILTTFSWMGVEAATLYRMCVQVFQTGGQKKFLIRAAVIALGKQLRSLIIFMFHFCTVFRW